MSEDRRIRAPWWTFAGLALAFLIGSSLLVYVGVLLYHYLL